MKTKLITVVGLLLVVIQQGVNANTVQSVTQVSNAIALYNAVDFHITSGDTPFATTGSVDITHDDAVLIFDHVKPSVVKSTYLPNIYINGASAQHDVNCRVAIHINGAAVYPHPNSTFEPLTVYTKKNYQGESNSKYYIYTKYNSLGDFDNCINSFKLKRGYMVTFATSSSGLGYSRVWIAQDADVEVPELSLYLRDKISFIRVFAWNNVSKRGSASGGTGQYDALNATWFYDWSAGDYNYSDYEYVPMRHHIGWPSFETIANNRYSNTVLGNNEPDNTGDERQNPAPYSQVIDAWEDIYKSGFRVGSPAMASNVDGWLVPFMRLCEERNYRIDFIAFHKYSYVSGSSYSSSVNNLYNKFHRPVWLTEYNYGANWTKETTWPDSNRGNTEANQEHFKQGLQSIQPALEGNSHLERYSIYTWVQGCRSVYSGGKATIGGEYYASYDSKSAYTGNDEVIPGWHYWAPTDLTISYSRVTQKASFAWQCRNYEQTDSCFLERLDPDATEWKKIARITNLENRSLTYEYDDMKGLSGYFTYRIHNYDNDGNQRFSGTASFTIGAAEGNDVLQYGESTIASLDAITTTFSTTYNEAPAVFMSIPTNANADCGLSHVISSVSKDRFTFSPLTWQTVGDKTISKNETIGFMALPYGEYEDGDRRLEVGTAKVTSEECEITFDKPFPDGEIPVVVTDLRPTIRNYPMMVIISDVTNTGFKCRLIYEQGYGIAIAANQTLNFMACSKGEIYMGDGKVVNAGVSSTKLYGRSYQKVAFEDVEGNKLRFLNPIIFGNLQDNVIDCGSLLRRQSDITELDDDGLRYVTGSRIRRQIDASNTDVDGNNNSTAEAFGWIVLSDDTDEERTVDIRQPKVVAIGDETWNVEVKGHVVHVYSTTLEKRAEEQPFKLYTVNGMLVDEKEAQEPGVYVVKFGNYRKKVLIR